MNSLLEFLNVSKHFNGQSVVRDISFSVKNNEFFSIFGKSGSGKTTILKLLSGIHEPDSGEIDIHKNSDFDAQSRRFTVTVWQSRALFPHLNVKSNVEYGLRFLNISKEEKKRRIEDVLNLLQIEDIYKRGIQNLSGGELQKVAIARALAVKPQILLLDEPFTVIDEYFKDELREDLRKLFLNLDCTFIMVSHDVSDVNALSDRIMVIEDNLISQIGTPHELIKSPKSLFIAKSFGQYNTISGIVERDKSNSLKVRTKLGDFDCGDNNQLKIGQNINYLINPWNIKIVAKNTLKTNAKVKKVICRAGYYELLIEFKNAGQFKVYVNSVSKDIIA